MVGLAIDSMFGDYQRTPSGFWTGIIVTDTFARVGGAEVGR
jgi:hypothetical protein